MSKKLFYLTSVLVLSLTGRGWSKALNPVPIDGAIHEYTWVSLSWGAEDQAVSYDIYIGTNYDNVKYGTGDTFQGNQNMAFFILGFPGYPYPNGLEPGTTYYWRIDEVNNEHPDSPWTGDVWSFMVTPSTAFDPKPPDGAEFVDPNVTLYWQPGFGAILHTVYFGDNFADVSHASAGSPVGTTSYSPGILEPGKTYYWRVDEFDGRETHKGYVWRFTVGTKVPAGGEEGIIYVDAVHGNDGNNGLTPQSPFATIQKGIDASTDGGVVMVDPGQYHEEINFLGKSLTVQGVAVSPVGVPVLHNHGDFAVSFYSGEGPDSVLKNFIIKDSFMGVFIADSSPTLSNLTIVGNTYGIEAYADSEPDISNTILWDNTDGDLFGCRARYSFVEEASEPLEGLISYWNFDEDGGSIAYDSAGGNHGTIHGAQRTVGKFNRALNFDGDDDYVELPDNNPVWLPQFDFSISVWLYFERDPGYPTNEMILDLNYANSDNSDNELGYNLIFHAQYDPRLLGFQMHTITAFDEDLQSDLIIVPNQWYHIAVVRNGTIQEIYINGKLNASRSCSEERIEFTGGYDDNKVNIGRFTTTISSPLYHFKGKLDELSIFDRGLSSDEVERIFTSGIDVKPDPLFVDPQNEDYHLKSQRGRYWPQFDIWVLDKVTSPCVDGGDPQAEVFDEPMPNGGRINIGAYGGTTEASLSPSEQNLPGQAYNPSPPDEADDVVVYDVVLSWTHGAYAVSHDVYFGTNDSLDFMGNQTTTQFDPGMLDPGTTYFWRIDEVNFNGKRTGAIWKFTTSDRWPPKGRTCFTAETGVWVNGALVPISKAAVGQITCGINNPCKIHEVQQHNGTFTCYDVLLESGNSISVAENHYFLTESGQWASLKELKTGTKLKTSKGAIEIRSITKRPVPYVGNVYNLNIAGSDRYLIGKDAVIVRDY